MLLCILCTFELSNFVLLCKIKAKCAKITPARIFFAKTLWNVLRIPQICPVLVKKHWQLFREPPWSIWKTMWQGPQNQEKVWSTNGILFVHRSLCTFFSQFERICALVHLRKKKLFVPDPCSVPNKKCPFLRSHMYKMSQIQMRHSEIPLKITP